VIAVPLSFPVTVVLAVWPLYVIQIEPFSADAVCVQASLNVPE
jgi:hypothetical protein